MNKPKLQSTRTKNTGSLVFRQVGSRDSLADRNRRFSRGNDLNSILRVIVFHLCGDPSCRAANFHFERKRFNNEEVISVMLWVWLEMRKSRLVS